MSDVLVLSLLLQRKIMSKWLFVAESHVDRSLMCDQLLKTGDKNW